MGEPCWPFRADLGQGGVLVGILEVASNKRSDLNQLNQNNNKINVLGTSLRNGEIQEAQGDMIWSLSISWLC